jgi:3-phenylpropionate/trans-cinnamate dioxygenase ferredoxin component
MQSVECGLEAAHRRRHVSLRTCATPEDPEMTRFVRVTTAAEIPADRGRHAFADGRTIALFKVDGAVYALDDSCPHAGSSLATGKLDGATVACRAHGLRFDVRTGRMRGVDGYCAKTYPVRVVDGEVCIGIDSDGSAVRDGDDAAGAGCGGA